MNNRTTRTGVSPVARRAMPVHVNRTAPAIVPVHKVHPHPDGSNDEVVPIALGKLDGSDQEADPIPDGSSSGSGDTNYALPPNAGDDKERDSGDAGDDGMDYLLPFPTTPMPKAPKD